LRSGEHRVLVLRAEPNADPKRQPVRIGERAPLTSGCNGRVILAHLPAEQAAEVISTHARGRRRVELERELVTIRADGYALSFSENHRHFNGIAAALLDDGHPLGALSIAGPDERLPEGALHRLAQPLKSACTQLAPHLANVLGPNSTLRLESLDVTIQGFVETAGEIEF